MTVSSTTNRIVYVGNGSTTNFPFTGKFFAAADLVVLERTIATGITTTKVLNSDYTVTGTQDSTGAYPNGGTVVATAAPATGLQWIIYRDPAITQSVLHIDNDPCPALSIDNPLDRLTIIGQRDRDILSRTIQLPDGDTSGASMLLPDVVTRASKFLGFDASGNVTMLQTLGVARGTWATNTAYNFGDEVVDGSNGANTGNGYIASAAHTSGVWATDLAAAKWVLAVKAGATGPAGASGSGSGNMINTGASVANQIPKYTDTSGTALAPGYTVGTAANNLVQLDGSAKLPAVDGSALTNLATSSNPSGTVIESMAISAPAGYLEAGGQAVSRATYATLFGVTTSAATVTRSNASPAVITQTAHGRVVGDKISFETTGTLPTGLTVGTNYFVIAAGLTANAFEVSTSQGGSAVNTSSAGSGTQTCRFNPYGCGDGSTTFNVIDKRDRASIGLDTLGGSSSGRVTVGGSGIYSAALGSIGGAETVTLTAAMQATMPVTGNINDSSGRYQVADNTSANGATTNCAANAGLFNTTGAAVLSLTGANANGGGGAHQNMIPVVVSKFYVKT